MRSLVLILLLSGCTTLASPQASIGCQAADVATTAIALHAGALEANPIVNGLLSSVGWPGFIAIKALMAWALIANEKKAPAVVATVNTATCAVAVHNLLLP